MTLPNTAYVDDDNTDTVLFSLDTNSTCMWFEWSPAR